MLQFLLGGSTFFWLALPTGDFFAAVAFAVATFLAAAFSFLALACNVLQPFMPKMFPDVGGVVKLTRGVRSMDSRAVQSSMKCGPMVVTLANGVRSMEVRAEHLARKNWLTLVTLLIGLRLMEAREEQPIINQRGIVVTLLSG